MPAPDPPITPDDLGDEEILDAELDFDAEDVLAGELDQPEGPDHRRFVIRKEKPWRLDRYLTMRLKNVSRNQVQKLIDHGGVTVNEKPPKASTALKPGDVIDIILPPPPVKYLKPEPIPLAILYEDEHFIVLNKQAGLIVHPARSHLSGTLINGLAHHFAHSRPADQRDQPYDTGLGVWGLSGVGAEAARPGIIHRLDKNTTGVMVVAKRDEAHWRIARQFEDRTTLKAYLAVVHGSIEQVGGVVEAPLGKHPTIREAQSVRHDSTGKPSVTLYRVRERYRGYTLVELELKTGRTHQIRVHLAYLGHPIAGDTLYGGEPIGRTELDHPPTKPGTRRFQPFARDKDEGLKIEQQAAARPDILMNHPALHAGLLRFTHPITRKEMTFTAPLHEPMATLVRELRQRPADGPVVTQGAWIDLNQAAPQ